MMMGRPKRLFVATSLLLAALPKPAKSESFPQSSSSTLAEEKQAEAAATAWSPPALDEYWFDARLDHFNFREPPKNVKPTLKIRYYVNQHHWNEGSTTGDGGGSSGPIFFYAGNEAPIEQFINNTGFIFESSEEFDAMVVFAEHRYYGQSMPELIDDDSDSAKATTTNSAEAVGGLLQWLTVEQAMADFNSLNVHIRDKWNLSRDTPFIVFGGSYGANLAMWLRLKNPNLWAGAVASSATPLKHLLRETNGFCRIETEAYGNESSACSDLVRRGWKELFERSRTSAGRAVVAKELGLCRFSAHDHPDDVHAWISGALETMVQYGYPYPTAFYNPVPAYPFRVACRLMIKAGTGLGALRAAADVYYNHTGQSGRCYDWLDGVIQGAVEYYNRKGHHDRLLALEERQLLGGENHRRHLQNSHLLDSWGYQTCTEVYQPMPTDGVTDFEIPYTPNQTAYFERCQNLFSVVPRPDWEEMNFMSDRIFGFAGNANLFLSTGQIDPWRAAGITSAPLLSLSWPSSIVIRIIENGAHHLDLRAANPLDPPSVVAVRLEEKASMRQWIKEWKDLYSAKHSGNDYHMHSGNNSSNHEHRDGNSDDGVEAMLSLH